MGNQKFIEQIRQGNETITTFVNRLKWYPSENAEKITKLQETDEYKIQFKKDEEEKVIQIKEYEKQEIIFKEAFLNSVNDHMEKRLQKIGCPTRYLSASFENYKVYNEKQKKCFESIKNLQDKWLCMAGETGTGKTHLAISILRERIRKDFTTTIEKHTGHEIRSWEGTNQYHEKFPLNYIYTTAKHIIDKMLAADFQEKPEILEELSNAGILIIDEIGRSIDTKYFQDFIFEILNNRYNEYRQTILISNLSKEELFGKYFDEAVARRISEMGEVINFDWDFYKGGVK